MDYVMEKLPDLHKTGETKYYPKVKHENCINHSTIVSLFRDVSTMSRSAIEGVLKELPGVLNMYLTFGHSVKLEGFGTFDVILGRLTEKEMADRKKVRKVQANRSGVYIKKINFQPDPEWLLELRGMTELNDGKNPTDPFWKTLTKEERLEIALEHIDKHGSMSVRDYMVRTGLGRVKAERDLKEFSANSKNGIGTIEGANNGKLYVKVS